MDTEKQKTSIEIRNQSVDALYGIGVFGAWVYYFRGATTARERVVAFFKGLFWPAFVVHDLMVFLEDTRPESQEG